jgi:hypothetical protein
LLGKSPEEQPEPDPPPPHIGPPPPPEPPLQQNNKCDNIPENLGHATYDSLKVFGLRFGASERDVKMAHQNLVRIYHPNKGEESHQLKGMSLAETTVHFQLLNKAQSHLRQVL